MNRLTEKRRGRNVVRCDQLSCNSCGICAATNCCVVEQAALDKLAAYEDTGLEPEEIGALLAGRDTVRHGQWGMRHDNPYGREPYAAQLVGSIARYKKESVLPELRRSYGQG